MNQIVSNEMKDEQGAQSIQIEYQIYGRVQGVGFRYFTLGRARRYGLKGLVKNQADGSVLCVASGSPKNLVKFARELRQGPLGSRVDRIEERRLMAQSFVDFQIL